MTPLPKTRPDAERLYAQDDPEDSSGAPQTAVGFCHVVEVLKDETPTLGPRSGNETPQPKFAGREQRWAAVDITADGLALADAFAAKGNMRGLGLESEKGRWLYDGNVAKIYGFGGRRV